MEIKICGLLMWLGIQYIWRFRSAQLIERISNIELPLIQNKTPLAIINAMCWMQCHSSLEDSHIDIFSQRSMAADSIRITITQSFVNKVEGEQPLAIH